MKQMMIVAMFAALLATPALAEGWEPCSMVTRDGRRVVRRTEGTNAVFRLVKDEGFAPARPWKIYVVKATHTDIGLHNSQYIQRHGTVKRIEDAMRLVDADTRADDDPAAYRYVMEGVWFWENYPTDRGEAAAWNVISNYVRRGRLDIACGCAGNHTHLFGPEEIRRSALTKRRLLEKWCVNTRTMIMADNPGISWSVVKPYAEAGIANVILAPNQWNPLPTNRRKMDTSIPAATWNPDARGGGNYIDVSYDSDRPMVFRWESYDRSTNLLVWCSTQYGHGLERVGVTHRGAKVDEVERKMPDFLARLEKKYPYDVWLACNYFDDEDANASFADFAAEWNAKWASPQFVTVGRLDEPFEALRTRFGDKIPVVRGEMTSGWLQHAVSVPEVQAAKFAVERSLLDAERAWRAAPDRDLSLKDVIDRAWWDLILNDEHSYGTSGYQGRRVFETWVQHRDWIAQAAETAEKVGRAVGLRPSGPGARTEVKGTAENAWYRIRVSDRGEILSLYDKELGRELLDGPANRLLYTRDNHKTWSDESLLGAVITRRVFLSDDEKRVDVENRFEHAADLFNTRRYYRHGYIAFPFVVPDGSFRAMLGGGEVIDPYRDQCGYTTDAYVAVRDWCAVENGEFGVSLRQTDTFLTEFGEIHADKTCFTGVPPAGKSAIYSYVFNDYLQLHVPDGESISFMTRYSITSYSTPWSGRPRPDGEKVGDWPLTGADFPEPKGDAWTGLLENPQASHGEKDGQLYLLWGAEMSSDFSHYELERDDGFCVSVTNEAPLGIPYRVARYVDLAAGSHTTRTYRVRKVWKDGRKDVFSAPFAGRTRQVFDVEAVESEGLRVAFNRNGGYFTSWLPRCGGGEVLFRPQNAPWGKDETHGGIPLCWPWFGKPPREGLPKHGLLRYARWTLEEKLGKNGMVWSVASTPETRQLWPHDFRVLLTFRAVGDALKLSFTCENTGKESFDFTWGFHPYFVVTDARCVAVDGVKKPDGYVREESAADGRPRVLADLVTGRTLTVSATGNANWLVWNPHVEKTPICRTLGPDEWTRFYCVEPCTLTPQTLRPGEKRNFGMTLKVGVAPKAAETPKAEGAQDVTALAPQDKARVKAIAAKLSPEAGFPESRLGAEFWRRGVPTKNRKALLAAGEAALRRSIPDWREARFFPRKGKDIDDSTWTPMIRETFDRIGDLAMAELAENKGRFLSELERSLDVLGPIPTWTGFYHDKEGRGYRGKSRILDLGSGMQSERLALVLDAFRDSLDPACRARAVAVLRKMTLDTYLALAADPSVAKRHFCGWFDRVNNWNAACNRYFVSAALHVLDDPTERATAIEFAERSSKFYLKSFTDDGLCLEGPGYWSYGFGCYAALALWVRAATGEFLEFVPEPFVRKCYLSSFETDYRPGVHPLFGDCNLRSAGYPQQYGRYFWDGCDFGGFHWMLDKMPELFLQLSAVTRTPVVRTSRPYPYPLRLWFPHRIGQLICRPVAGSEPTNLIYAAIQGGYCARPHGHHDVGSYSIAPGGVEVMGDLGNSKYTYGTFGPDRFRNPLRNSYGHPVPRVDGCLQSGGELSFGRVLATSFSDEEDAVSYDLASAYRDVKGLKLLRRDFCYRRAAREVEVVDRVAFDGRKGTFETAFTTTGTFADLGHGVYRYVSRDGKASACCRIAVTGAPWHFTDEELPGEVGSQWNAPGRSFKARRQAVVLDDPVSEATVSVTWSDLGASVAAAD